MRSERCGDDQTLLTIDLTHKLPGIVNKLKLWTCAICSIRRTATYIIVRVRTGIYIVLFIYEKKTEMPLIFIAPYKQGRFSIHVLVVVYIIFYSRNMSKYFQLSRFDIQLQGPWKCVFLCNRFATPQTSQIFFDLSFFS